MFTIKTSLIIPTRNRSDQIIALLNKLILILEKQLANNLIVWSLQSLGKPKNKSRKII